MARRSPKQLELPTWGGRRRGAGRRLTLARPEPPHLRRVGHSPRHPVHVTLRCQAAVPSLRRLTVFPAVRRALAASNRIDFRVIQFSVQTDHVHLIVEADATRSLARGLQGLAGRCARAINRCSDRVGPVWAARYHARPLATPSEMRLGLVYVLLNFRKHLRAPPGVDPCSSGPWFDGWAHPMRVFTLPRPVALARTWLATTGWRLAGGLISVGDAPRRVEARSAAVAVRTGGA